MIEHIILPKDTEKIIDVFIGALRVGYYVIYVSYSVSYQDNEATVNVSSKFSVYAFGHSVHNEDEAKEFFLGKLPSGVIPHVKFIERKK